MGLNRLRNQLRRQATQLDQATRSTPSLCPRAGIVEGFTVIPPDGVVTAAPPGPPCPLCGGNHDLVIVEEIVEAVR